MQPLCTVTFSGRFGFLPDQATPFTGPSEGPRGPRDEQGLGEQAHWLVEVLRGGRGGGQWVETVSIAPHIQQQTRGSTIAHFVRGNRCVHLQLTATLQGSGNIAHTHYSLPATLLLGVLLLGVLLLGVLLLGVLLLGVLLLGVLLLRAIAHFHLILRYMCSYN